LIVKVEVALTVGVPEIVSVLPVDVPSLRLAGREPAEMLHVNVPVAVVEAVKVCEYVLLTVPFGSVAGVIVRAGRGGVLVGVEVDVETVPRK
jgi:predicted dinucleotide-binding enzyme